METIPGVAKAAAGRFGDKAAIVDGDRSISYSGLWDAILRAAAGFAAAGLAKGDRVAIWAPNQLDWIVGCIGAQAAGCVVVPLNTRLKGGEAAFILNRSRARWLMTVDSFIGNDYRAMLASEELPHLERIITFGPEWDAFLADAKPDAATEALIESISADDPSDIMFTSGTTGDPKGVISGHGQTCRTYRSWTNSVGLTDQDRYLIVNPFFHSFGYKAGWLPCLMMGATIYPLANLDVVKLVALVSEHKITMLPGPPAIFQTILATDIGDADLSSLRLSITGAASIPPALIERMRNDLGIETVLTGYGLTETCGTVSLSDAHDPAEVVATTCGKPIPGIEVRIADAEGNVMAQGDEGEVQIRGFNVMLGYFEDPQGTAEAIDAEGWLHTGDVGKFVDDGRLVITDRMKDMYISGGFNCYPAEIEKILQRHPDVALAAVIGVPDERMGEVGKAFVIPVAGAKPDPIELAAWAKANMANYKAPRYVEVVESLPLNASGKVQKFALKTPA